MGFENMWNVFKVENGLCEKVIRWDVKENEREWIILCASDFILYIQIYVKEERFCCFVNKIQFTGCQGDFKLKFLQLFENGCLKIKERKIIVLRRAVKFLELGAHRGLISKRGNTTLDGYF